jgi:hypothetical protein
MSEDILFIAIKYLFVNGLGIILPKFRRSIYSLFAAALHHLLLQGNRINAVTPGTVWPI